MTQHLLEAILVNFFRSFKYAIRSKGFSIPFSLFMIFSELLILPSSFCIDFISLFWRIQGIPVMKKEFISMFKIRKYSSFYPEKLNHAYDPSLHLKKELAQLKIILKKKSLTDVKKWALALEEKISFYPRYFCMLRHMLESLIRLINLEKKNSQIANEKKVMSPFFLYYLIAYSHTLLLSASLKLDKKLYHLQKQNIPIIYQDVPYIPPH